MAVYMIKGNGMDIAELKKVAETYAKGQRFIETVDPHAMLELIAEIERLREENMRLQHDIDKAIEFAAAETTLVGQLEERLNSDRDKL